MLVFIRSTCNGHQGDMPYWCLYTLSTYTHQPSRISGCKPSKYDEYSCHCIIDLTHHMAIKITSLVWWHLCQMTWIAPMENWRRLYKDAFFKYNLMTNFESVIEIEMRYIPKNLIDDMVTLVHLMAWCSKATSPYVIHCRPHLWCHMA